MRRNRRIKKNSRFATSSMGVASLIVSGFIMMMIFFAMNSRCSSISKEIFAKENELKRLEAELTREKTRWDEMKVPDQLNMALTRFGLEMDVPREDQIVRMGRSGTPVPGQIAVARLRGVPFGQKIAQASGRRQSLRPAAPRRSARNGVRK